MGGVASMMSTVVVGPASSVGMGRVTVGGDWSVGVMGEDSSSRHNT